MAVSTVPRRLSWLLPFPFTVTNGSPRIFATAITALSLSACDGLLDFDCGVASRTVANGVVRDPAGATLPRLRPT